MQQNYTGPGSHNVSGDYGVGGSTRKNLPNVACLQSGIYVTLMGGGRLTVIGHRSDMIIPIAGQTLRQRWASIVGAYQHWMQHQANSDTC